MRCLYSHLFLCLDSLFSTCLANWSLIFKTQRKCNLQVFLDATKVELATTPHVFPLPPSSYPHSDFHPRTWVSGELYQTLGSWKVATTFYPSPYPQHTAQCLVHSRHSILIWWMSECKCNKLEGRRPRILESSINSLSFSFYSYKVGLMTWVIL